MAILQILARLFLSDILRLSQAVSRFPAHSRIGKRFIDKFIYLSGSFLNAEALRALQGAFGNLAGGLMIIIFKPFKIGDYIESTGAEGYVRDISIFYTTVMTLDNKKILVPNGDLMNANVTNFSAADKRRVDQDFKITNDIDADFVKRVLLKAAIDTEGVLTDPAPFARMTNVDDDTYIFSVRAWCETPNYWDVLYDLIENCSKALAENGIDDPEERIAVRLVQDDEDD